MNGETINNTNTDIPSGMSRRAFITTMTVGPLAIAANATGQALANAEHMARVAETLHGMRVEKQENESRYKILIIGDSNSQEPLTDPVTGKLLPMEQQPSFVAERERTWVDELRDVYAGKTDIRNLSLGGSGLTVPTIDSIPGTTKFLTPERINLIKEYINQVGQPNHVILSLGTVDLINNVSVMNIRYELCEAIRNITAYTKDARILIIVPPRVESGVIEVVDEQDEKDSYKYAQMIGADSVIGQIRLQFPNLQIDFVNGYRATKELPLVDGVHLGRDAQLAMGKAIKAKLEVFINNFFGRKPRNIFGLAPKEPEA